MTALTLSSTSRDWMEPIAQLTLINGLFRPLGTLEVRDLAPVCRSPSEAP